MYVSYYLISRINKSAGSNQSVLFIGALKDCHGVIHGCLRGNFKNTQYETRNKQF